MGGTALRQAVRADLANRLRILAPEIEGVIFSRVRGLSEPAADADPEYVAGQRSAIAEALHHGLDSIEKGREFAAPVPSGTAKQARRAARDGVRLDTVLRRYAAGSRSLEEFVLKEAQGISSQMLCQILSDLGPQVDRLMEAVAAEYRAEIEQAGRSSTQRQADHILAFLESHDQVGPVDLDYDFDRWHVGLVLTGRTSGVAVRASSERFGCSLLSMARDDQTEWAWLGSKREFDMRKLTDFLRKHTQDDVSTALGEPRRGVGGWRLTFREAQAALEIMLHRPQKVMRCRDVILESAVMRNDWLTAALVETYLVPLDGRGDASEVLRKTVRAYLGAGRNAATTAVALGVARNTVERRLRSVEEKLGQSLDDCSAQLQVALGVEELLTITSRKQRSNGEQADSHPPADLQI